MTDLSDVTTEEMFDELAKRHDGVVLASYRFLGGDRYDMYTNWSGPKVVIAGLHSQLHIELDEWYRREEHERVCGDDDDDD